MFIKWNRNWKNKLLIKLLNPALQYIDQGRIQDFFRGVLHKFFSGGMVHKKNLTDASKICLYPFSLSFYESGTHFRGWGWKSQPPFPGYSLDLALYLLFSITSILFYLCTYLQIGKPIIRLIILSWLQQYKF